MAEIELQESELAKPVMSEREGIRRDEEKTLQRAPSNRMPEPTKSRSRLRLFAVLAALFVCISIKLVRGPDSEFIAAFPVHCSS